MGRMDPLYAGCHRKHDQLDNKENFRHPALIQSTKAFVREKLPKRYSWELVQVLFAQPYCRIENLVEADIAERQTASAYLKQLVEIGVLEEMTAGRERLYINTRLLPELNNQPTQ